MDEIKKPTTKMKKRDLKEMIKAAFMAENSMDDDAALKGMYGGDNVYEAEEKEESLDDILARIIGTKADPYMAEDLSEAEEEADIEIGAEEEVEDEGGEEEKPANDSIVVDKRIVSLSSLPSDTRKILDSLETLRAQAEEFGDQKFITQVGNTITFFTRDFVVAGDEPTKAKVDESLEMLRMKKIAGLLTEGEYAKALLRENYNEPGYDNASPYPPDFVQGQYDWEMEKLYDPFNGGGNKIMDKADKKIALLSFIKQNKTEVAKVMKAVRLEDIMIDDKGDVGATGVFNVGNGDEVESGLAFRFPEDVDNRFRGEEGDKPKPITIAGKQLMYIGYNI
jgi:hypothetical protein